MAQASDFNVGKYLDWDTEIPYPNRPRESPTFVIQNTECYFHLCNNKEKEYIEEWDYNYFYDLYCKPKDACAQLKTFKLVITVLFYGERNSFQKVKRTFNNSKVRILRISENCFKEEGSIRRGFFVRFLFQFENDCEPLLPSETNLVEKSTQANLMFSLLSDMEYLSLDFGALLKTGDHSDVQLLCSGGSIPAHKAILAARSEAFSDMLRDDMEENNGGLISLSTTELPVMELCLEFIYKGKISKLPVEMAPNIYALGRVLKISSLPEMCADLMISNLCEENYISYLVLADKHDDSYFKDGLIEYISDHTELLKSESWMKFADEYTKTAVSVYKKCMLK